MLQFYYPWLGLSLLLSSLFVLRFLLHLDILIILHFHSHGEPLLPESGNRFLHGVKGSTCNGCLPLSITCDSNPPWYLWMEDKVRWMYVSIYPAKSKVSMYWWLSLVISTALFWHLYFILPQGCNNVPFSVLSYSNKQGTMLPNRFQSIQVKL